MSAKAAYEAASDVAESEIPIIDIGPFLHGTAADRKRVADQIGEACHRIGFFYVKGHDIPLPLLSGTLGQARRFFERPFEDKMRSAPRPHQRSGFLPSRGAMEGKAPGDSLVKTGSSEAPSTKTPGGLLEQFTAMRPLPSDDPDVVSGKPLHAPNIWPKELDGFEDAIVAYQQSALEVARELLKALALSLGLDEKFFYDMHRKPLANFGFNHYPPPASPDAEVGVGTHCDTSTITVLLQDDVGGLEVCDRDGRWITAPYVPGAFVVNIGEIMMNWTNGYFISTPHRVVSRKPTDRYSIALFMSPDFDVTVGPLPVCVTPERPPAYEAFQNGEYLTRYFDNYYGKLFVTRREIFEKFGLLD